MIPKQTQEPITTDVPLGLDEPAPILVWRSAVKLLRPTELYAKCIAVFTSEEAALRGEERWITTRPDWYAPGGPPYRIPLEDAIRSARARGNDSLWVFDESLRLIEVYPL